MKYISVNYFQLGSVVQEKILFKDNSYLELWQPFVLCSGTICASSEEGIMRNISMKLLNLNQWFRSRALVTVLFAGATVCVISVEGIMRNISVKLFLILTSGSGDIILRYFLSTALAALLLGREEPFVQFW